MPNGTVVLIRGKILGRILHWCNVRKAYLVEIQDTLSCQYIDEKYLTK